MDGDDTAEKDARRVEGRLLRALSATALAMALIGCGSDDDGNGGASGPDEDAGADNCPGLDNPSQLDTDADGLGDACDTDDDGDGFADADDPAPLDPSVPGDFSTPEAILDDPIVRDALEEAERAGVAVRTETGLTPPDIGGYYDRADGSGVFTATSDGSDVGRRLIGAESRVEQGPANAVDSASVGYSGRRALIFGLSEGSLIRGEGNRFTVYSRNRGTCTEAGSDYDTFGVGIYSAEVEPESGDIVDNVSLSVTIDTAGELSSACAARIGGVAELAGEWSVVSYALRRRVEPSSLLYMCVDGDAAYVPTETWTGSDGMSCECTEDYQISCR